MTRDELEAAIWRYGPGLSHHNSRAFREASMDAILSAADAYAAYTGGIAAERRAVLGASQATRERDLRAASRRSP